MILSVGHFLSFLSGELEEEEEEVDKKDGGGGGGGGRKSRLAISLTRLKSSARKRK